MSGRSRAFREHDWQHEPGRLLGHEDPYDLWGKLNWEAGSFAALRRSDPPIDIDGVVYLLQNACVSAVAAVEWLRVAGMREARARELDWDVTAFDRSVGLELPHFELARAIANTLRHGRYRDEGWGDAQIMLEPLFTAPQRERLDAAKGTERFEQVYAEEAAECGFRVGFTRGEGRDGVDADTFVAGLADGVLRLLDASGDGSGYLRSPAGA